MPAAVGIFRFRVLATAYLYQAEKIARDVPGVREVKIVEVEPPPSVI